LARNEDVPQCHRPRGKVFTANCTWLHQKTVTRLREALVERCACYGLSSCLSRWPGESITELGGAVSGLALLKWRKVFRIR
jgi:hypothetical protein